MERKLLTLLLFLFASFGVFSQNAALKELYDDAEFFLLSEDYTDALSGYLKIQKRGYEDNANIQYKIGICFLNLPGQKMKAIDNLEKACKNVTEKYREGTLKETQSPTDAFIFLGNAYRVNDQVDKAIESYKKFKSLADPKKEEQLIYYADRQIQSCQKAKELKQKPIKIQMTNLGENINNSSSNFKPVVSGDESTIVYMNELKFYDAIFFSKKKDGEWMPPTNITPQIRSDGDQYTTGLSFNGNMLYLAKEDFFNSDIYYSEYERGRWSISQPLNKNINTKYWESHACISKDGKQLFFTSNRSDRDALGGMDVYVSYLDENGEWGSAQNLGPTINTEYNEETPFITPNGKRLYFSSQGHDNMGGYDVFYSEKGADGKWQKPKNIGYPISTTDDDLFFVPVGDGSHAYASQYKEDGYGKEDIYMVEILGAESSSLRVTELNEELYDYLRYRALIKNAEKIK